MASNPLERTVIAAARALYKTGCAIPVGTPLGDLLEAVEALEAANLPQEVGWHEVAAGDRLKSVNNGRFYEVTGVISLQGGRRQITIDLGDKSTKAIIRPTPAEPTAFVRRGQDGRAVDMFVSVFTSGGA